MASKRAKKHRETVKYQQATKQLSREIKEANRRLVQLEKAGIKNTASVTTTNAAGGTRIKQPKTIEEIQQTKQIVRKFLGAKTSTKVGAQKAMTKNRADFAEFLRRASGGKISESTIALVADRMGDLPISDLIKTYVYNEIVDMVYDIENSGITATADNVKRGLETTFDNVILDEFSRRGIDIPSEIQSEAVAITKTDGIDVAVDYIESWKREKEREEEEKRRQAEQRGSADDDKS